MNERVNEGKKERQHEIQNERTNEINKDNEITKEGKNGRRK